MAGRKHRRFFSTGAAALGAVVTAVGVTLAALAPTASGAATATNPTWLRQIGKSGHAGVYAWGMATATDGTILVGDYNNYVIRRYTTSGTLTQTFSGKGTGPGQNMQPYGLGVDPNSGAIYLADNIARQVEKFNANGTYNSTIDVNANGGVYASRVAVDNAGNVYVVNSQTISTTFHHSILVYNSAGTFVKKLGSTGTGDGQFSGIRGIAFAPNGQLYVVDAGASRVEVIDTDGNFIRKFGSFGSGPGQLGADARGIAIDGTNGWVYVSDAGLGRVEKWDLNGNFIRTITVPAVADQKSGPRELTVGHDHNVYVADYANDLVDVFNPNGVLLHTIPTTVQAPPNGGLNQPEGVGVNRNNGNVYVTDTFNNRVQQFTGTGTFVRTWGFRGVNDPNAMNYPRGVAIDTSNNNVWVNNTRSANIKAYTATGGFIRQFGDQGADPDQFYYSRGIYVEPGGRVVVTDSGNLRMTITDQLGNVQAQVPCGAKANPFPASFILLGCTSVTEDPAGNIYAAAPTENVVYKFDHNGNLLAKLGAGTGTGAGQLDGAYGVAIDNGVLYVSEMNNNRISEFDLNGTFLASFGAKGTAHGQFNRPTGLAVDASHHLFVTDTGNDRIEEFTL